MTNSKKIQMKNLAKTLSGLFEWGLLGSSLIAFLAIFYTAKSLAAAAVVKVDGSSTVFPITEAVAEEFQRAQKGKVNVTVGISGTGGGFKKFCRGETDVQDASRPILKKEMDECTASGIKYFELPIGFDATVIVVNKKNNWLKEINVSQLKKMWAPEAQGKVMKWKDVDPSWPDKPLKLFGAGSDSGTFDYFNEAIQGENKAKASRGDYNASEDDNTLIMGVKKEENALAYVPLAYYEENRNELKLLPLIGGPSSPKKNEPVMPTTANIESGAYYPLTRPIFIYVSEASLKKPEVADFVKFYLEKAVTLIPEVKSIPLPKSMYDENAKIIKAKRLGTLFGGKSEVGMSLKGLADKERKM